MVQRRGFTLLEVLFAIAIFGLVVTIVLAGQGGIAASNLWARNSATAISLGRCKMSEIEEELLRKGYAENDEKDERAACCDDKEVPGFRCAWKIEKVTLPEPGSGTGDGGTSSLSTSGGPPLPGLLDAGLGTMAPGALSLDAGMGAMGAALGAAGGPSGILQMVFSLVYPSLKILLEASIRRVTLQVLWKEGSTERDLTLVQFVTNPARGGFTAGAFGIPTVDGGTGPTTPSPAATSTIKLPGTR